MPFEGSVSLQALQWPHRHLTAEPPFPAAQEAQLSATCQTERVTGPARPAPRGCIPRSPRTRFSVPGVWAAAARARGAAAGAGSATHHQEEEEEKRDAAGLGRGPHAAAAAQEAAAPRGVALPAAARPGRPRRHGCGRSGFLEEGLAQRSAAPRAAAAGAEKRARLGRGGIRPRRGRAASERTERRCSAGSVRPGAAVAPAELGGATPPSPFRLARKRRPRSFRLGRGASLSRHGRAVAYARHLRLLRGRGGGRLLPHLLPAAAAARGVQ